MCNCFINSIIHHNFIGNYTAMKIPITQSIRLLVLILPLGLNAQILSSNGATIFINNGGQLHCNGGVELNNNSTLSNNGQLRTTKNASIILAGTLSNNSLSSINGNGNYYVEQDWVNNAIFTANSSSVYLYGNTEQLVTSTNGTVSEFNQLVLQGVGTGVNRKKTLQSVDARISSTGNLQINNRELATGTNSMTVLNPSASAVSNSQTMNAEGFVSSLPNGYLSWASNTSSSYIFPVGSSDGSLRYRPVIIQPKSAVANMYHVRMNNTSGDTYGYNLSQHDNDIETLNSSFFHSIEQEVGGDNADVSLAYLPSADGEWSSIAQWNSGQILWNSIAPTNNSNIGNYNTLQKTDWNFANPAHPYVIVNLQDELNIPNVFTPNQDGANDTYLVSGKGIIEYNIVIVNRWGNLVYQSDDITTPWDGTSNGTPCAEGVYFYIIQAKSITQEYNKQGHLTLNAY
jgi:gliding motility-associated-like protein